jgi:hypothetical protein
LLAAKAAGDQEDVLVIGRIQQAHGQGSPAVGKNLEGVAGALFLMQVLLDQVFVTFAVVGQESRAQEKYQQQENHPQAAAEVQGERQDTGGQRSRSGQRASVVGEECNDEANQQDSRRHERASQAQGF